MRAFTNREMKEDARELRRLLEWILDNIPDSGETGILLSGGLDSSALACILLSKGRALRSISTSFKGLSMYDETEYVEMTKDRYPRLETNYLTPLDINLLKELRRLIAIIEQPIISGSALLQYLMMKKAKELGLKNLIYGQWADELMGGYDYYLLDKARDNLWHLKVPEAIINILQYVQRARMVGTDLILLRIIKNLVRSKGLRPALNGSIPNIRHLVDIAEKTAKALEINLIIPYADSRIVEFCQTLSPNRLVYRGETKIILREAVVGIVPERILKRKNKFGFFAPDATWLFENRDDIEGLKDKVVDKEYKKLLKNPQKRWHKKLWLALSNSFIYSQ